jgi:integrative and conjugative element protein (TIGR02256 family)
LKLNCKDIGLSLEIKDELLKKMKKHGKEHYPNEYGGLLVGRYSDDLKSVLIEESVLPMEFKSSRFKFERGVNGLKKVLHDFFKQTPSLFYVGEWHTHPGGAPVPSITDVAALRTIANHNEVYIENPILLIIGIGNESYELGFYVLFRNEMYRYDNRIKELVKEN